MAFRSFFKTCVLCAVTKRSFLRLQSRGRRERPWSIQNFRRLYRRWYRPMLLYARSLTGDLATAEDLVQNAFAKAAAVLSRRRQCARLAGDGAAQ